MQFDTPTNHDWFDQAPRRRVPAWLMSMAVHVGLLVIAALAVRGASQEINEEPPRAAGIVLAEHSQDVAYFTSANEAESETEASAAANSSANSAFPEAAAAAEVAELDRSPELPGQQEITGAENGLLQDVLASGGGRGPILPGLGDAEILANDPILNAPPQAVLGPTATMKIFGTTAVGRSFVMLIDRSKSMGGEGLGAIEAAEKELARAMETLTPQQKFQIVAYNQHLAANDAKLIPATDENKTLAVKFIRGIVAHGQTEHRMALLAALRNQPEVIYVFTDAGDPVLNQADLRLLTLRADRKTVIHCVQFGFGPLQEEDPYLRKLTRLNGGSFAYVDVSQRSGQGN